MKTLLYVLPLHENTKMVGRHPKYHRCAPGNDQPDSETLNFNFTSTDFGSKNICIVSVEAEDDVHTQLQGKPDVICLQDGTRSLPDSTLAALEKAMEETGVNWKRIPQRWGKAIFDDLEKIAHRHQTTHLDERISALQKLGVAINSRRPNGEV